MRDVPRLLVAIELHREGSTLTAESCSAMDQAVELVEHLEADVALLLSIGPDQAGTRRGFGRSKPSRRPR